MKYGGERKRSTYDWSSQGGKLPRCVLPRTGAADAAELRYATVCAAYWSGHSNGPPRKLSWQGSRQKAAQTSSVAARLTAVQPAPAGRCGTVPAASDLRLSGRCLVRGRSERGVSLGALRGW